MTAAQLPSAYRLNINNVDSVAVQVAHLPHLTVVHWLLEAASKRPIRHPVAGALAESLSPRGRQILPAMGMPGLDRLPDLLTTPVEGGPGSIDRYAERLTGCDPALLTSQVYDLWHGRPPRPWRSAADRPGEWLEAAALAVTEAWALGRTHWQAADLLFRREEARVGVSAVTGMMDTLINAIDPRIRATETGIEFTAQCTNDVALGARKFVLAPMLAPAGQVIVSFDRPGLAYIAYPLPGLDGGAGSAKPPVDRRVDGLATLVGPIRAAALRALDRPQTMTVLARTLHISPSTLTHHCDQLFAAGLLRRERHGRSVWVSRTDRALRLIDLMAGAGTVEQLSARCS